jgi:hypothetical protein
MASLDPYHIYVVGATNYHGDVPSVEGRSSDGVRRRTLCELEQIVSD